MLLYDFRARLLKSVGTCVVVSGRGSPVRRARLLDAARLRPSALAALPRHNKLPAALHKHYTALELEEEVIRVPVKSPTEPLVKAPADETAV
ncbi:hypothetical protein HF086_017431 [Spodoptera exigua]|uniref:Uncharacterized protein n=1 Tax=Spodoptera exigua TaxID=7107 RepID=A0A922MGB1_SPOEX|nr:hypothetical protein HF086_017431 [Spodoptera exigua]